MALVRTKSGGARVEVVFAAMAFCAVIGMGLFLFVTPAATPRAAPATDPVEVVFTDLMAGEIQQFSPSQVRVRLETYMDRSERTDAQLRNAHRSWAERLGDPRYADQALANDMFVIIDHAMRLRGVRPHPGV
ncbi:hypothetical protein [Roseicyclus marinus]|uniref:hypothetical protein n=1 Tax=Roseicyclus marinus TaxID=2161673 RepID=UPI00240FC2EF|nr:hypothetical protein [Roseicyclus marinus]MDG3041869.1 hypothetical protein [Roseicyclus marinus]